MIAVAHINCSNHAPAVTTPLIALLHPRLAQHLLVHKAALFSVAQVIKLLQHMRRFRSSVAAPASVLEARGAPIDSSASREVARPAVSFDSEYPQLCKRIPCKRILLPLQCRDSLAQ